MLPCTTLGFAVLHIDDAGDGSYAIDDLTTLGFVVLATVVDGAGMMVGVTGYRKRAIETKILCSLVPPDTVGSVELAIEEAVAVTVTDPSTIVGFSDLDTELAGSGV